MRTHCARVRDMMGMRAENACASRVKDVMTALEHCFATMLAIYKSGFTRIPVYVGARTAIVGILYVKDLILVDPDDETELGAVLAFRSRTIIPLEKWKRRICKW